jgi:hypothetical protein
MTYAITLSADLMTHFAAPSPGATKCVAELAMALHYLRRDMPGEKLDAGGWAAAAALVAARVETDAWLGLGANGFLVQQCVTPYLFLRDTVPPSRFHEALLADFFATDRAVQECTPYRRMERAWLLAKLGAGALPTWDGSPIMADAQAAYAFNRDLSYAFTHTVFFCTDFAGVRRPDPAVKTVAMMIAAQSHAAADVDLCFESAICLMSQDLTPDELTGLVHLVSDLAQRHAVLFAARRLAEEYHPLFVHDILRGLLLRWHGIDIAQFVPTVPAGPYAVLRDLAMALGGKDAGAMVRALAAAERAMGPQEVLRDALRDRLGFLERLSRRGALFEREFAWLGRRDDALYPTYADTVGQMLAGLRA